MKILMVLTSHDQLGNTGRKTGFWLEEFAAPYYTFLDAGAIVTLASPKGGQPPIDPVSDTPEGQTDSTRRFKQDPAAQACGDHRLDGFDAAERHRWIEHRLAAGEPAVDDPPAGRSGFGHDQRQCCEIVGGQALGQGHVARRNCDEGVVEYRRDFEGASGDRKGVRSCRKGRCDRGSAVRSQRVYSGRNRLSRCG